MKARRVVAVLLFALAVYFVFIGYRGVYLLTQPGLNLKVFGVAVLVLPVVGAWVVVAELRFGAATQRLAERLNAESEAYREADRELDDGSSDDARPDRADLAGAAQLPRRPSGRVDRRAADAYFAERKIEVEQHPDEWQRWYRLAEAYDLAGDRKRAREAMRQAISVAA